MGLPCEQRPHFRGMSWRAKSSLCRQLFNFLSCMRKIRHAIRKQLVRQICVSFTGIKIVKTTCEQLSSSFICFVFLLCPPLVLSILAEKNFLGSSFLGKYYYATNFSKSCLLSGELNSKRQFSGLLVYVKIPTCENYKPFAGSSIIVVIHSC